MNKDIKITREQVDQVREKTLVGMWDSREALYATGGNVEEAIELIEDYYYISNWEIRYKLMTFEKKIKALEELIKEKKE